MAKNTDQALKNCSIYSIYIRNHSAEGNFEAVEKDLERIRDLGTDIIWFLPIHPIGIKNRKGKLGCPYAIRNYREINPEYGTFEDFKRLVDKIHQWEMKCMIDVVYHHTSPDSWLVEHHPEFFYRKNGKLGNKIGDWWDVVDLDYQNRELWDNQIETLKMWGSIVDGFRCDVASMVPIEFWKEARSKVDEVNADCFWLAESVHGHFIREVRERGFAAHSDSELYEVFDVCYDYDVQPYFDGYLNGKFCLQSYVDMLNLQEVIYPENYIKLRFLENHDNLRAKFRVPNEKQLRNWTAFLYFQKGSVLIYAGQEMQEVNTPSLFEADKLQWRREEDWTPLFQTLYRIKKDPLMREGAYRLEANEQYQAIIGYYWNKGEQIDEKKRRKLVGIFGLQGRTGTIEVDVEDGNYTNLIDGSSILVNQGRVSFEGEPMIFQV